MQSDDALINLNKSFLLHWVFKIKNLESVLDLLKNELSIRVLRHEEFNSACEASCNGKFQNAWSKTMVGIGDELSYFALELVYNYSKQEDYKKHRGFFNLEFYEKDFLENGSFTNFSQLNIEAISIAKFNQSYCKDYLKILIDGISENDFKRDFKFLTLKVNNLETSVEYYEKILNMTLYTKERIINPHDSKFREQLSEEFLCNNKENFSILGFDKTQTFLKLIQSDLNEPVFQSEDSGRMAFACEADVFDLSKKIEKFGKKILHQPVVLKTEGKADVKVIILQDPDDYEICFVEREGFRELSNLYEGVDFIDWEMRKSIKNKILRSFNQ